jgi:hypothetical protein
MVKHIVESNQRDASQPRTSQIVDFGDRDTTDDELSRDWPAVRPSPTGVWQRFVRNWATRTPVDYSYAACARPGARAMM